jgi:hypothetical protein
MGTPTRRKSQEEKPGGKARRKSKIKIQPMRLPKKLPVLTVVR